MLAQARGDGGYVEWLQPPELPDFFVMAVAFFGSCQMIGSLPADQARCWALHAVHANTAWWLVCVHEAYNACVQWLHELYYSAMLGL